MKLVAQAEATKASDTGHWFGMEVFQEDDRYLVVVHTSLYDGIKRTSHYATPPVPLEAETFEAACEEARQKTIDYVRMTTGAGE